MFRNFFKVAMRNIWKNRFSSMLSLLGLTIAIGSSVVCFLYVDQAFHLDTFHENVDRMYLIENVIERSGQFETWGDTPIPLGPALKEDCPLIENSVRLIWRGITIRNGNDVFDETLLFVDNTFFDSFSFPILRGDNTVLKDPNNVVLTGEYASKYFGEADPIGKELIFDLGDGNIQNVIVGAVIDDVPQNSSFHFNILVPYESQRNWGKWDIDDWTKWTSSTVIQLNEGVNPADIPPYLEKYVTMQNETATDWIVTDYPIQPLLEVSKVGDSIRGNSFDGAPVEATGSMTLIAVILLLLASFNFTNASLVNLSRRYREIGIRKVVGSTRGQLAFQHLGENVLFSIIALIMGIFFAKFVVIPGWYVVFSDFLRAVTLDISPRVWMFLVGVVLMTGIGSGLYPAIFVSGFKPVDIFKGPKKSGGHGKATKLFIAFQFALTFMSLAFPVALYMNSTYQQKIDWGYSKDHIYTVPVRDLANIEPLMNKLAEDPNIISMAPTSSHIGHYRSVAIIRYEGVEREASQLFFGPNYAETMGVRLLHGAALPATPGDGDKNNVLVNQTFVEFMEWENPIDKQFLSGEETYTVIGVVEDFHVNDFMSSIRPLFIRQSDRDRYRYVAMKLQAGDVSATVQRIEDSFTTLIPDENFDGFFQDTVFEDMFRLNTAIIKIFGFTAVAALLISVMGLFSLVSATLNKRQKEISIRKVLGSTLGQIIQLISRPILLLLLIASAVATVPGAFLIKAFIESMYEYHIDLTAVPFLLTLGIISLFSVTTMLLQILHTANSNPASVLRNE